MAEDVTLDTAMGKAYLEAMLKGNKVKSHDDLKATFEDNPSIKAAAETWLAEINAIPVVQRDQLRQRCFITNQRIELIKAALA